MESSLTVQPRRRSDACGTTSMENACPLREDPDLATPCFCKPRVRAKRREGACGTVCATKRERRTAKAVVEVPNKQTTGARRLDDCIRRTAHQTLCLSTSGIHPIPTRTEIFPHHWYSYGFLVTRRDPREERVPITIHKSKPTVSYPRRPGPRASFDGAAVRMTQKQGLALECFSQGGNIGLSPSDSRSLIILGTRGC